MMLRTIALTLALSAPAQLAAQEAPPQQETASDPIQAAADGIVAFFNGAKPADQVFAPAFLAAVPEAQLQAINAQFTAQFGALQGLEGLDRTGPDSATISLRFAKAIASGPMKLDANGRIVGLLLNQFNPIGDSADKIGADLAALPGETSIYYAPLAEGAQPIVAANADEELAIGSVFKLYVLSTLAHQVEAGKHRWDEVVPLAVHSLPSGQMQNWPLGSPVTLHTLATLMISNSDNTATDQLIEILGRDAIADELRASGHSDPDKTLPLVDTLELFALKGDPALGASYLAAAAAEGEDEQRRELDALSTRIAGDPANVTPPTFTEPTAIDSLEWFASGRDIAGILRRIVALKDPTARDILSVSPAMADATRAQWAYVGYKGGSEPGVLNLTWLLQGKDGAWRVLSLGWNDPKAPVDPTAFNLIAQRVLALPH